MQNMTPISWEGGGSDGEGVWKEKSICRMFQLNPQLCNMGQQQQ